ncbi:MAG: hypothetical protein KGL95_03910 [Patescibacteria group bacterium]|nr:hypothetical protein [Patescibacteria group bacterium]
MVRYFKNDPDLIELVREAIKMRLTYKNAVAMIKEQGYEISEKKFGRIKKMLEKKHREIMTKFHGERHLEFNAEAVETLAVARKEIIEMVSDKKLQPWERIKAAVALSQNLRDTAKFYDAIPIVKELAERDQTSLHEDLDSVDVDDNKMDDNDTDVSSTDNVVTASNNDTGNDTKNESKDDNKPSLEDDSKINAENSGSTEIPSKEYENGKTLEEHPEDAEKQ